MERTRLVVFDDSRDAITRYAGSFANADVDLLSFRRPTIDTEIRAALIAFQPDLVIVDLVMGESRHDGYRLLAELQEVRFISGMPPVVVCSKLITHSQMGEEERRMALAAPGVVAAFGKFPDLPSAEQLLQFVRRRV